MIVDTMTNQEISREIYSDYEAIVRNSLSRIDKEYIRERKKKKIPATAQYTKPYEIRTKKKNRWILLLSKPPAVSKFKDDACSCFITYHYGLKGLRVFKIIPYSNNMLSVFHSHVFQRYCERMGLNIEEPLERVEHFFIHNGFFYNKLIEKGDTTYNLGKCRDGLLLGTVENNGSWIVQRTFISNQLMKEDQNEIAASMMDSLQGQIEEALNYGDFDKNRYEYLADIMVGLRNTPRANEGKQ